MRVLVLVLVRVLVLVLVRVLVVLSWLVCSRRPRARNSSRFLCSCLCVLLFLSSFLISLIRVHCWQSIRNHDQGKKHVEIVAEFFRKKREDKLKGAQSESDLARQMERIEQVKLVGNSYSSGGAFGEGGRGGARLMLT